MSLSVSVIPVTAFQQNCSILKCEETGKVAVVDPGGDLDRILQAVEQSGGELEKILITHAHMDHVGATADLAEQKSLPIEGPQKADQFWIDQLPMQAQMLGLPAAKVFTPNRWLEDGDTVTVGNQTLQVLHCPGHTPGHVIFYHPKTKFAIVGDVLFAGSIGRTDFPMSDHQQLLDSIKNKLWALDDDITFLPGHGPTSTFGHEKQTNPFVSATYK